MSISTICKTLVAVVVMCAVNVFAQTTFTVTFNSQGGSAVNSQIGVVQGSQITKPADPTRANHIFGGWYKEAACITPWNFDTDVVTSSITLFAKWTQGWHIGHPIASDILATLNNGTFTVSGTGAMRNFGIDTNRPWHSKISEITSVIMEEGVTTISDAAFSGITLLTFVTIPASVTAIGDNAFVRTGLTSITIPNGVTTIGKWAFVGCSDLISIDVAPDHTNFSSEDGVLFNEDKTTLVAYPGGKQGAYTIPTSVITIGYGAFSGSTSLTSVTIGNSVTTIEYGAFWGCTGLTSVTIGDNVTTIGSHAFAQCNSLTSVTIGNSVTTIGNRAFWDCSRLTSITIPTSVTMIENHAFASCLRLASITSLNPEPPTIQANTFDRISANTCLYVPENSVAAYTSASHWSVFSCINPRFTVIFNSQGGSAVNSETVMVFGAKITKPADPTFANRPFLGWYTDTTYANKWDFDSDVVTRDTTLYARWFTTVTNITDVPATVVVGVPFTLTGTVVPADATNKTIVWSIENAGITGAGIYDGILLTTSEGTLVLKATIKDGIAEGSDYEKTFFITVGSTSSILSEDRAIPPVPDAGAIVTPITITAGEFTVGPNPVSKSSGSVAFYWQGKALSGGTLSVFDANGNFVARVSVSDNGKDTSRREIGSWNFGNIAEGTYVVRGVLNAKDGTRERVSVVVGVVR